MAKTEEHELRDRLEATLANKRSLVDRVRALLGGGKSQELEDTRKENARLNQQLSLAQFQGRRGR